MTCPVPLHRAFIGVVACLFCSVCMFHSVRQKYIKMKIHFYTPKWSTSNILPNAINVVEPRRTKTLFPIYNICQTPGNMLWIRIYNTLTNPIEIHFSYAHAYVGGDVGSSWVFFCNVVLKKCEKSYSST